MVCRFDTLPDDIIECIYKFEHSLNFIQILKQLKFESFFKRTLSPEVLYLEFYNSPMTNKEIYDFNFCIDWLDGYVDITPDFIENNKYYKLFQNMWLNYYFSTYVD